MAAKIPSRKECYITQIDSSLATTKEQKEDLDRVRLEECSRYCIIHYPPPPPKKTNKQTNKQTKTKKHIMILKAGDRHGPPN